MARPYWMPRKITIQGRLVEELARLESIREKPVTEAVSLELDRPQWIPPEPLLEQRVPFRVEPPQPLLQGFTTEGRIGLLPQPEVDETPIIEPPAQDVEWWEQPKVATEKIMSSVGKGISKVPLLPEALEFIAPAFEWIHEKLEKPFASIITAPFSPKLAWRSGESWLEHEKREFAAWDAPTYVKGAAEFAMPLWWIPYLGWAAKGAKAIGVGNKMAQVAARSMRGKTITLPSSQTLTDTVFKQDTFKRFSLWAENKKVLGGVVRAIGGPAAFVSGVANDPMGVVKRAILKRAIIYDMRHGGQGILMPRLQRYGDPVKLLNLADDGLVKGIVSAPQGMSRYIYDVLEAPMEQFGKIRFQTPIQRAYIQEARAVQKEIRGLASREGIKLPKGIIFHRIVKGKKFEKGYVESEFGSQFEMGRIHPTMESGVRAGIVYGVNPNESIQSSISHYFKQIANKRFADEVRPLGKTAVERYALANPDDFARLSTLGAERVAAKKALQAVTRVKSFKGASIPPATMGAIKSSLPKIGAMIERTLSLAPQDVSRVIRNLSVELRATLKITPDEFLLTLGKPDLAGRFSLGEISRGITSMAKDKAMLARLVERIHKQAYKLNKAEWDDAIKATQKEVANLLEGTKGEFDTLIRTRRRFLADYRGVEVLAEEPLAIFRSPSMRAIFKNRFFDRDVAKLVDKVMGDKGIEWLGNISTISGTSRMLVAAMDFSAPFIQGLAVLGRNPLAWVKGVTRQYEFFLKPGRLQEYMVRPEIMAIAQERWFYGGSRSSFEFFQALEPLQRGIGKIPKVGELGKKAVVQTYGRAEAAFTGFGEVARNEMWKALRRPGMNEGQLRELARSIDRMTGVMSVEALGMGLTKQQFENAFLFFAPRYTRASLSYVSDVFKGGLTGAEARKALGGLMAGGFAMYYGISTVLGQQPNLNPRSGRFLTVKIGDDHVGVGGILYGLIRFGAGVIATATEEPMDLVQLNRIDNPFIKFMFNRTAPMTGFVVGLLEQKNYFGEPFETPQDWGRFMAEKVTPIALQRFMDEQPVTPQIFAAEISGGRTFPKGSWELQEEAREKLAQENFGQTYETLDLLKQREINRHPTVTQFQEEIDRQTSIRGDTLSVGFMKRRRDRDDARFLYEEDVWQAQNAVDNGFMTPFKFKERLKLAREGLHKTYQHIDRNPDYADVMEELQKPRDISNKFRYEIAYDEYMSRLVSGEFEDEFGIFDFDAFNELEGELNAKYGEGAWGKIQELRDQTNAELPPLFHELEIAKDVLRPYWQVKQEAEKIFGVAKTVWQKRRLDSFVAKVRKRLRTTNPEIAKYIAMFYTRD